MLLLLDNAFLKSKAKDESSSTNDIVIITTKQNSI